MSQNIIETRCLCELEKADKKYARTADCSGVRIKLEFKSEHTLDGPPCSERCLGGYFCTRHKGHSGKHEASGDNKAYAIWKSFESDSSCVKCHKPLKSSESDCPSCKGG